MRRRWLMSSFKLERCERTQPRTTALTIVKDLEDIRRSRSRLRCVSSSADHRSRCLARAKTAATVTQRFCEPIRSDSMRAGASRSGGRDYREAAHSCRRFRRRRSVTPGGFLPARFKPANGRRFLTTCSMWRATSRRPATIQLRARAPRAGSPFLQCGTYPMTSETPARCRGFVTRGVGFLRGPGRPTPRTPTLDRSGGWCRCQAWSFLPCRRRGRRPQQSMVHRNACSSPQSSW